MATAKPPVTLWGVLFWWIPGLVQWSIIATPFVLLFALQVYLGSLVALVWAFGSVSHIFRVVLYPQNEKMSTQAYSPALEKVNITAESKSGENEELLQKNKKKRVAVIGCGPSGLVATKEILQEGHEVTCYDGSPRLGGEFANGFWPGGHLTSSPYTTAFGDFEPPRNRATGKERWFHFTKDEYTEYLQAYVDHFGVADSLHLNEKVMHVSSKELSHSDGHQQDHPDRVFHLTIKDGNEKTRIDGPFDHLVIASGAHRVPQYPKIPGLKEFEREIYHTAELTGFKTAEETFSRFSNKRVVTVGLGESMSDIIGLMCSYKDPPTRVAASTRSGAFVIPRINALTGTNNDFDTTRLRYALPKFIHNVTFLLNTYLRNIFAFRKDPADVVAFDMFRQTTDLRVAYTPATKSDRFVPAVISGRAEMKRQIERIEDGRNVHFKDGTVFENTDVILFGTGFQRLPLPIFDVHSFGNKEDIPSPDPMSKYLRIFDPKYGSSIAFVGFGVRPLFGTIPTSSEMQSRLLAMVISGKRKLPSKEAMMKRVKDDAANQVVEFEPYHGNWRNCINWIPYMDMLAKEMGCLPPKHWLITRPKLGRKILSGAMCTFQYRLVGPGAVPELAEDVIKRMPAGTRLQDTLFFASVHLTLALFYWPFSVFQCVK